MKHSLEEKKVPPHQRLAEWLIFIVYQRVYNVAGIEVDSLKVIYYFKRGGSNNTSTDYFNQFSEVCVQSNKDSLHHEKICLVSHL